MRLIRVHITDFQSIHDSTPFDVGDVTCLVGKNESGKTALLKAIYRLNPIHDTHATYDVTDDYPRSTVNDYEAEVDSGSREAAVVARTTFALEPDDIAAVEAVYGDETFTSQKPVVTVAKNYDNKIDVETFDGDCETAVEHLTKSANLSSSLETEMLDSDGVQAKIECLNRTTDLPANANTLKNELQQIQNDGFGKHVYERILRTRMPKFVYFDEYYQLSGQDNIGALQERVRQNQLRDSDHPLLGLIELAGLKLGDLENPERTEWLIARLEGAENALTQKVLTYWSQNRHLRLKFAVEQGRPKDPAGMTSGMNIWGRVQDTKHMVSTSLGSRSRGFVWFFSFLAWYSQLQRKNDNLILLLDEPGLSLHAKAQADLLQYFDKALATHHQVIYTTHSPFMVDSSRFDRVRIVQDRSVEEVSEALSPDQEGTKVTIDVLEASADSLFPLQAALGYEIHQTLFIGPNSLIVEGPSDLLYIQAMSGLLESCDRVGLKSDWTVTPVGGLGKLSTFVALIGSQSRMNLATLVDYHRKDQQAIENLYKLKLMKERNVLTFADFVDADEADVEDMFTPEFYLDLVNREFGASIQPADLPTQTDRVLGRLEKHLKSNPLPKKAKFNHYRPARYLMENLQVLTIPSRTLDRFEKAFDTLNHLLP